MIWKNGSDRDFLMIWKVIQIDRDSDDLEGHLCKRIGFKPFNGCLPDIPLHMAIQYRPGGPGGWLTYPSDASEKYLPIGMLKLPTEWKNKTCSKPAIRIAMDF